jgi:hypothetical protein
MPSRAYERSSSRSRADYERHVDEYRKACVEKYRDEEKAAAGKK